eukprot:COSAG03_NODE_194_length_10851_cov_22.306920_6_plen_217_part_00
MQLQCPAGASAGQVIPVDVNGQIQQVTVPAGVSQGMVFAVTVPAPMSGLTLTVVKRAVVRQSASVRSNEVEVLMPGDTVQVIHQVECDQHVRVCIGQDRWVSRVTGAGTILLREPYDPHPSSIPAADPVYEPESHFTSSLQPLSESQPQLPEQSELHAFLSHIRLLEYYEPLVALGAVDLRDLTNLEEVELADMGMNPLEARRLQRELEQRISTSI